MLGCDRYKPRPDQSGFSICKQKPAEGYILERLIGTRRVRLCKECANHFITLGKTHESVRLMDDSGDRQLTKELV